MKNFDFARFLPFGRKPALSALALAFLIVCATPLAGQNAGCAPNCPPPHISIQGTLKSANGATVADGGYTVTFRLYTAPTGGSPVWSEAAEVEVIGGIYSHLLGTYNNLNPANFGTTLYLGVVVGQYELVPRTELSYAPYSFSVAVAQKVLCSGAVGDVKYSVLNPTQFAAENGDCWVPMDGQALATTDRLRQVTGWTNVPNAGGLFFRSQEYGGSNNDPGRGPNDAVAQYQGDEVGTHGHSGSTGSAGDHAHWVYIDEGGNPPLPFPPSDWNWNWPIIWATNIANNFGSINGTPDDRARTGSEGSHTHSVFINNHNGSETRPKNLNLYAYIRIN